MNEAEGGADEPGGIDFDIPPMDEQPNNGNIEEHQSPHVSKPSQPLSNFAYANMKHNNAPQNEESKQPSAPKAAVNKIEERPVVISPIAQDDNGVPVGDLSTFL